MSETRAVPEEVLRVANRMAVTGTPLCPSCLRGYLQPYLVTMNVSGPGGQRFHGADFLQGWVAICQGDARYRELNDAMYATAGQDPPEFDGPPAPACGFTMPMTGHNRLGN